jgi:hypothetical protein
MAEAGVRSAWRANDIPGWDARMVTGFFTGRASQRDANGCSQRAEKCQAGVPAWPVWEFRALTAVEAPGLAGTSPPWEGLSPSAWPRVLSAGRNALDWPPPLEADRPWLVIVASFPLESPQSARQAEKLSSELRSQGWNDAEVIDSRSGRALDCCYLVVSVGRWPTREAAEKAQRSLARNRRAVTRRAL